MKRILDLASEKEDINYKRFFLEKGIEIVFLNSNDEDAIAEAAKGAEAIIFAATRFTDSLFSKLPDLKIISRRGIGIDTVDMDAATKHGVKVCNCPSYGAKDVAQHTIALMLSLIHRIPTYDSRLKQDNNWRCADVPMACRLCEKTVGIIGFGRISREIAKVISAFGAKIIVYDPYVSKEDAENQGVTSVTLDELLVNADIISVNAPLTKSTRHIIDKEAIKKMRDGALIINTSRGPLIDENVLIEALESGKLGGAALDVFENEPFENDSKFRKLENVVLTPHVAWHSAEAIRDLDIEVTQNIIDYFEGRPLKNALN